MCGIAGVVGGPSGQSAERMRRMRDLLIHRGPDSGGEVLLDAAALGVRRLRIIDLVTGDQPQSNEDRSVWTVYNGEIYNFRELRRSLEDAGHRFATASDTEVIVHLYEERGERFVEGLDGMFALALWDARRRTLVLARDHLGKKPLLYCEGGGEIAFASEHAALLAGLSRRPDLAPGVLAAYLRRGYVPAPFDAFDGVRKLAPGHLLVWCDGRSRTERYWAPPWPGSLQVAEGDALAEIRRLVRRAVERRLVADVPVGAFLSGGVDSSVVVTEMAAVSARVRTFSIGFEEADYSELPFARAVAGAVGAEHREFTVRPPDAEVLPLLARHYGEPYADSSALPTYLLARLVRGYVTVALNGDGGDEVFLGYDRYVAVRLAAAAEAIPLAARAAAGRLLGAVVPGRASARTTPSRVRRFAMALALPSRERYLRWTALFDDAELAALLEPDVAQAAARTPLVELTGRPEWREDDPVGSAQMLDLSLYLPDDLLAKVDIASMACSLEVRSPLLDRELVEFVVALPSDLKLRGGRRKRLLRAAFAGTLPRRTIDRAKRGFAVPMAEWLRGPWRELLHELLLSPRSRSRGLLRPAAVRALVDEHERGRTDHAHRLWALIMLELWHRDFVDRAAIAPSSARASA